MTRQLPVKHHMLQAVLGTFCFERKLCRYSLHVPSFTSMISRIVIVPAVVGALKFLSFRNMASCSDEASCPVEQLASDSNRADNERDQPHCKQIIREMQWKHPRISKTSPRPQNHRSLHHRSARRTPFCCLVAIPMIRSHMKTSGER